MSEDCPLEPLGDRLIVEREQAEEVTQGGIILPTEAQEQQARGTVIAVGEGNFNPSSGNYVPLKVQVGDEVLFGTYSGSELENQGKTYLVLRESDILAKVR